MKKISKLMIAICMMCILTAVTRNNQMAFAGTLKKEFGLSSTKLSMPLGNQKKLFVNGTTQKVTWSSSDSKIVTVNQKGVVKTKRVGTAKIIAKVGKKKLVCHVTVKNPVVVFEKHHKDGYTALFSDGFMVEAVYGKLGEANYKDYEVNAYYGTEVGAVVKKSLKKATIKGYDTRTGATYNPVPFTTYSNGWDGYKIEVFSYLDFFQSIKYYTASAKQASGNVVFKKTAKINALKYNDNTHKVTMYF